MLPTPRKARPIDTETRPVGNDISSRRVIAVSKYKNKKITYEGLTFDSRKEWLRYLQLKAMWQQGKIRNLELQKEFVLVPAQYINGKCAERAIKYVADFYYYDMEKKESVCEDVKGYRDGAAYRIFVIKRKLMLREHGIKVIEV